MLFSRNLKLLCLGFLIVTSSASANEEKNEEKKEEKKENKGEGKDVTLEVEATQVENVDVDSKNPNDVVYKTKEGFRFKTLKVGDKTLYTVDTGKFKPVEAHRLKHGDNYFFLLKLDAAQPLMFKKKSDKEWNKLAYENYLDRVVWKDKESKDLDVTKHSDESLFESKEFGTGKEFVFKHPFKVKKVVHEKVTVHGEDRAKYTGVRVYQSPDAKRMYRLNYFYTGDERFKEVYYKYDGSKAVRVEVSDVNKFLKEFNNEWPSDYKPLVDRFSPLAVLASLVIVTLAVFYNF